MTTSREPAARGLFATLLLMAVGAGFFQPIISGASARTTSERNSGREFGACYWLMLLAHRHGED